MRDEMEARMWGENHEQFSRDLESLFEKAATVFQKLVEIEFEAPWTVVARRCAERKAADPSANCPRKPASL